MSRNTDGELIAQLHMQIATQNPCATPAEIREMVKEELAEQPRTDDGIAEVSTDG